MYVNTAVFECRSWYSFFLSLSRSLNSLSFPFLSVSRNRQTCQEKLRRWRTGGRGTGITRTESVNIIRRLGTTAAQITSEGTTIITSVQSIGNIKKDIRGGKKNIHEKLSMTQSGAANGIISYSNRTTSSPKEAQNMLNLEVPTAEIKCFYTS